jgi:hypothetical protein
MAFVLNDMFSDPFQDVPDIEYVMANYVLCYVGVREEKMIASTKVDAFNVFERDSEDEDEDDDAAIEDIEDFVSTDE